MCSANQKDGIRYETDVLSLSLTDIVFDLKKCKDYEDHRLDYSAVET